MLTVLLPCRDAAAYLPPCIASLSRQSFPDFEVVAVDDGSTDETAELLAQWRRRDRRVRIIEQGRLGLVAALNHGLTAARGEVLARMDADDIAHPRRLEMQLALLRSGADVVSCLVRCFPRSQVGLGMRRYERWLNFLVTHEQIERDLFVESPLAHPTAMLRTRALRDLGGYRDQGWPEDYDLWMRAYAAGLRFAKLPRRLYWWRERADRLSRVHGAYSPAAFRRCKVHYLKALHLHGATAVTIWGAGKEGKALARHLRRENVRIAAFLDVDPQKIGTTVLAAPVVGVGGPSTRSVSSEPALSKAKGQAGSGSPRAFTPSTVEGESRGGLTRDHYLLVAVGAHGARDEIRAYLDSIGWHEPRDYRTMA